MNETVVRELTAKLANQLLSEPNGVDEESYATLLALVAETNGEEVATILDAAVDATDGYFYFPIEDEDEDRDELERLASLEDLLRVLDTYGEEEAEEDEEPVVEIYDDRAD